MSPDARTQTAQFVVERTNHEVTVLLQYQKQTNNIQKISFI